MRFFVYLLICLLMRPLIIASSAKANSVVQLQTTASKVKQVFSLAAARDFLGARVLLRKLQESNLSEREWHVLRSAILTYPQVGIEMLGWGDKKFTPPTSKEIRNSLHVNFDKSDAFMEKGRFNEAFKLLQATAQWIKKTKMESKVPSIRENAKAVYPFLLHGMARALFGAKRFDEAWKVYTWVPVDYPQYRQVLFEKMWTAFKLGKADLALGMIASQRSKFFSKYIEPESYLLLVYLYKTLCRDQDLKNVINQIREYKKRLNNSANDPTSADSSSEMWEEWAKGDLKTRILFDLSKSDLKKGDLEQISLADREKEQRKIVTLLKTLFMQDKKRILSALTNAEAYANLAVTPMTAGLLRPIEKIQGRAELLSSGLEIWPADTDEEWLDEVGNHRFIGESLCASHSIQK